MPNRSRFSDVLLSSSALEVLALDFVDDAHARATTFLVEDGESVEPGLEKESGPAILAVLNAGSRLCVRLEKEALALALRAIWVLS